MTNAPITEADDFVRGEDQGLRFTIRNNAGAPVNITGWAIRWRLFQAGNIVLTKTVGSGITITDGEAGALLVQVNVNDTELLTPARDYFYGLWRTDSGATQRLASGSVVLHQKGKVNK